MKKEMNCHICGSVEDSLAECEICGELTCLDSEECSEILNDDQVHCKECLSKQTRYECHKCKNQYTEECPFDSEYQYCYDCPEYYELDPSMNIVSLIKRAHGNAADHGWWDEPKTFGELIALIHSEASEALEEFRNGNPPTEEYFNHNNPEKPEGIPSELADIVIRVFDLCGHYNIDLEEAIKTKMKYNESRPYKHGGKKL